MADVALARPPAPGGFATWHDYWTSQGMPWRFESEIDTDRQAYLAERRAVIPDIEKGIYPFRDDQDSIPLTRADVEWLLATHESRGVTGPVVWDQEKDKPDDDRRVGLDLRGADLRGEALQGLPLSRLVGGMDFDAWYHAAADQREAAAVHLEVASLAHAHLEGAGLVGAHLECTALFDTHLDAADLGKAYLTMASLTGVHLADANLSGAHLEGAFLGDAHLEGTELVGVHLGRADLTGARLDGAELGGAHLGGAILWRAHLEGADLQNAHLEGAEVTPDDLARLRPWVPDFPDVVRGAVLSEAYFDSATSLRNAVFGDGGHGAARLVDARLGDVNLAVVDWAQVHMLGDEQAAWAWKVPAVLADELAKLPRHEAQAQERAARQEVFDVAVRANRQLATALRAQGLNEHADRFAYRAQVLQRTVLRLQRKYFRAAFSWFLDALAGHGFRPERSLIAYLVAIVGFAVAYFMLGRTVGPHLSPLGAFVFSMTSFHGRGFFPGGITLDDPITVLAAFEAFTGLVIEVSFIATFTQRFFAR